MLVDGASFRGVASLCPGFAEVLRQKHGGEHCTFYATTNCALDMMLKFNGLIGRKPA
jgi:hypothetical protein